MCYIIQFLIKKSFVRMMSISRFVYRYSEGSATKMYVLGYDFLVGIHFVKEL